MVYKPPIENMRMKQQRTMRRVSLLFFYLKAPHKSAFRTLFKSSPPPTPQPSTHTHMNTLILSLKERKINNRKQRRKHTQDKSDFSWWPHGTIYPKTPGLLTSCSFFLACFAKSDKSAVLKQTETLNITETVCYIQNHINTSLGIFIHFSPSETRLYQKC